MSGQAAARLLVVEDEPSIRELLAGSLRYAGFEVAAAGTAADALRLAAVHRPDLVVLDVMLPDGDGFDVLRRLRAAGPGPAVVFLTKPFALEELIARIAAVLRRTGAGETTSRVSVADLELDEDSHQVWRDGRAVSLSPTEFRLLHYLMVNAGRVLSKAQILDRVWNYDFNGDANVVELYVSYLRRKIDTVEPRLIHTLRGVGYVMRAPKAPR